MKLFVALVVALIATISVSMALDASVPAWLEKMGPGETYTHGETAIETHMSPGRGSHVTDGKPHIVIRSR